MKKIVEYGYVDENGKLVLSQPKRMKEEVKIFKGFDVELIIKKKGRRSNKANRYYWGCIVKCIKIEFNRRGFKMDAEQVHEFLKLHFNKQYVYGDGGEVIAEYGGSTAEMNQEEMTEYFESIIQWCAEKLELTIDPPNTQTRMFAA